MALYWRDLERLGSTSLHNHQYFPWLFLPLVVRKARGAVRRVCGGEYFVRKKGEVFTVLCRYAR